MSCHVELNGNERLDSLVCIVTVAGCRTVDLADTLTVTRDIGKTKNSLVELD